MTCPACGLLVVTGDRCPLCQAEGVDGHDPDGQPIRRQHRLSVPPEHDAWHDLLTAWFVGDRLHADVLGRGERTWLDRRMGWAGPPAPVSASATPRTAPAGAARAR